MAAGRLLKSEGKGRDSSPALVPNFTVSGLFNRNNRGLCETAKKAIPYNFSVCVCAWRGKGGFLNFSDQRAGYRGRLKCHQETESLHCSMQHTQIETNHLKALPWVLLQSGRDSSVAPYPGLV